MSRRENPNRGILIYLHREISYLYSLINAPLYKNSIFIYFSALTYSGFGFLFWVLAARLYSAEYVGISSALISSAGIIVCLSSFGFQNSLIRFLPESANRSDLFNSTWLISLVGAILFSLIFIGGIDRLSPSLRFLTDRNAALAFIIIILFLVSNNFINTALLSLRRAEYSFAQNLGFGIRILLLIPMTFAGVLGIFGSLGIASIASFFVGIFFLSKINIYCKLNVSRSLLRKVLNFSLGNYVNDSLLVVETSILPILVLNTLGPKQAGYFYVAFAMASLLFAIPNSVFMSMFVEGSHGEPIKQITVRSLKSALLILIPCGIIMYFFGDIILGIFSIEYSEHANNILKLLVVSSFFITINSMYLSIRRIQKRINETIIINAFNFFVVLLSCFALIERLGMIGLGLGWIFGQAITSIIVVIILFKYD